MHAARLLRSYLLTEGFNTSVLTSQYGDALVRVGVQELGNLREYDTCLFYQRLRALSEHYGMIFCVMCIVVGTKIITL